MLNPNRKNAPLLMAGVILSVVIVCSLSCGKDNLRGTADATAVFLPKLSDYSIFVGNPQNLVPSAGFHMYTLATTLFTDYAEKQRLIRLPVGTTMTRIDDDLPSFPDSTMIVKTFYYYNDLRDTTKGKRLVETRLQIKIRGTWNLATYVWNDAQQEAYLQLSGSNTDVTWITATGERRAISYHVPNSRECSTCHQSNDVIMPIGPKLRNMNMDVTSNGQQVNQLQLLQEQGILASFDPHSVQALPQAFGSGYSLADRARAYLEINCADCHNSAGDAKKTGLYMQYKLPFDQTGISSKEDKIEQKTQKGEMPLLGTTIIDSEGVALIKQYIDSLKAN